MKWIRYRFKTRSARDYRPLKFNESYPYWCSGYGGDMGYATMVAFLPKDVNLTEYWDDAFDVDSELLDEIKFTDRFPRPDWYKE